MRSSRPKSRTWIVTGVAVSVLLAIASLNAIASPSPSSGKPAPAATASQGSGSSASTTLKPSTCATEALTKNGATCYEFTGEENWDHPNGKTVTLPVAVFPGSAPQLAPVFFIPGGPGSTALGERYGGFSIQQRRDAIAPRTLVLVDSRGLIHAKPALQCPGYNEINHFYRQFAPDIYGLESLNERINQQVDFTKGCYDKLTKEGNDLTQYTDYQVTRDYDEIRKALGHDTVNIWGISTGGGTAESYLKYHGSHVRAAILEVPWVTHLRNRPALDEFYTEKQVINNVLAVCVRDNEECARRFPGYMMEVDRARAILDAKPYLTTVRTETGGQRKIRIDGTTFLSYLDYSNFESVYHLLPKTLEAIKRGDYAALDEFFDLDAIDKIVPSTVAFGHQLAVICGDMGKNRPSPKEAVAVIKREPALIGYAGSQIPLCAWWGEDGDAPTNLNTPLVSDVPTLAIHGQMDTCCSIRRTELLAESMPKLQRVEIQGQGHVGPQSQCRPALISAFLNSPDLKVDDSCKDDIPLRPWVFYDG